MNNHNLIEKQKKKIIALNKWKLQNESGHPTSAVPVYI